MNAYLFALGSVATVVVIGGMGCAPRYDDTALRAIEPAVYASCDPDGMELAYDVEYFSSEGEHILRSVEVRELDEACLGQRVRIVLEGDEGTLGEGSSAVDDDRVTVRWEPLTETMGAEGETFITSNLDIRADDVRAISVRVAPG